MTDDSNNNPESPAKPSVRGSGPVEGARGNREVPPASANVGDDDPVAALQAERDEVFDRLQRLAAEFDNYRKRNARENAALLERANERLVKDLIPILDDLGRALEAAAEHEEAKLEEGVRLVHRSLADLLAKEGLSEIVTEGKFDPHVHEALLSQPSDADEGSVIEVVQKGYKLGDKVLRPARVVVAAAPQED
ncbi:MAG: nucleotide exchange factor GrpE [Gaiellaceae bacterium]